MSKKNKKLFLGLDVSLTNSGVVALGDDGDIRWIQSVRSEPTGDTVRRRFDRYRRIARKLWATTDLAVGDVAAVAVENYSLNSKGRVVQLVENGTLARYIFLKRFRGPIVEVAPVQLKKWLLGKVTSKGKNIKNVMCREVFRKYKKLIDDDNQVDAYVLARIARAYWIHLRSRDGGEPVVLGKPQAEVLQKLLQKHGD